MFSGAHDAAQCFPHGNNDTASGFCLPSEIRAEMNPPIILSVPSFHASWRAARSCVFLCDLYTHARTESQ